MTSPPTKGRTGRGQLLLFVALLFGIVGMHTLGHPTGHAMEHPAGRGMAMSTHAAPSQVAPTHAAPARVVVDEHPSPGDGGMDPLSVCLAVLGSFTLLLLTAAVLRPPAGAVLRGPVLRGPAFAQRPNPPPPRSLLSRLSVLRI
ncbi:DUF6153 family protein [Streptomyces sp. NPDC050400]|uniref:DUF6153 family protein n=1 Tax=Streptomyces sp. NPDC050400 TaxID=3365610 RepID=UPI0037BD5AC2